MQMISVAMHADGKTHRMYYRMDTNTKMMTFVSFKDDPAKMNWIIPANGTIYPWINDKKYEWGTIKKDIPQGNNKITVSTTMRRYLLGYNIVEEYTIENNSKVPVDISQLSICTPWNARYLSIDSVKAKRCTVEVFIKDDSDNNAASHNNYDKSCVKATRINGHGPHVGLVITRGNISGYTTGDCNDLSDNSTCGIMYMIPEKVMLQPKKKYVIEWHIFSYNDDEDFRKKVHLIK